MTKSTITREESIQAVFDLKVGYPLGLADIEILKRVARMALAAMDSEPVAEVVSIYGDPEAFGGREIRPLVGIQQMPYGTKLYRHVQQPVVESEPVALQPELAKVIYHFRDWNEGFPVERFKADYVISWMLANYPPVQPAPVVSAELLHTAASAIEDLLTTKDRTGACVWFDLPFRLRSAANAQPAPERDQVRIAHAEWSQSTFGNVGPAGPLKHLSKEALETAADPDDLSEWADMQFLLWDAQRRSGITDEQITQAMIDKLAVNKQREWPEPKDGEPRLHIK